MELFEGFIEFLFEKMLTFITKHIPIPKVKNKYLNGIIEILYWCVIGFGLFFLFIGIVYFLIFLIALIIAWVEKK